MRAEGRARHLPELSRRFKPEPDADPVNEAIQRMTGIEETMAALLEKQQDMVAIVNRPVKEVVRPAARRVREFSISRDEDGAIESITAFPDDIEFRIVRDGKGRITKIKTIPKS